MDSGTKSNSSSSNSIQDHNYSYTVANDDDENLVVVASKKIKLSACANEITTGSNQDVAETSNGNFVLASPSSARSPQEFAFSIDLILESIFMKCDRRTLLKCRRVSRRWAYVGSKVLQNNVSIGFHKSSARFEAHDYQFIGNRNLTLNGIIAVMKKSTHFPCTSFEFNRSVITTKLKVIDHTAQAFFNTHGASIRKIKFTGDSYVEDLKQLVLNQAPNLQQLYLGQVNLKYTSPRKNPRSPETQEQQSERERREESLFEETTSKTQSILKNLKIFRCHYSSKVPPVFIQHILECSPNLVDVSLPSDYNHYLIRPLNRIHLVKKLMIDLNSSNIESYERFANHLQDNENFAVLELYYCSAVSYEKTGVAFNERAANVMRKILKTCSATCQKLVWGEKVCNLKLPEMPQVKHLIIQYYSRPGTCSPVNGLPDGLRLGNTFPNLKSLEIRTRSYMKNLPIANIFSDEDPLPAARLETVTLRFPYYICKAIFQDFRSMFPNACIRIKFVAERFKDGYSDEGSGNDDSYTESEIEEEEEESDIEEIEEEESDGDEEIEEEESDDCKSDD